MPDWPHSPLHRLDERGTFMVTAGTYRKEPFFGSSARLTFLQKQLFVVAREHSAALQAWAIFPNHYHIIARFEAAVKLRELAQHLHSVTAREVNRLDGGAGRKVWFQYWDSQIFYQKSYFARLRYVHENPVRHRIVARAENYGWCSAGWFQRKATPGFRRTVLEFPCESLEIPDEFAVTPEQIKAE
jgi:putative transposase